MFRHIVLIVGLTVIALAAGVALIPGEREQWTMLVRDGHHQEAIRVLENRYRHGHREMDAVLHMHKLYMALADIGRATRVMENFVADRPGDPAALTLLARHYGDIQDKAGEIRTLERLFELEPSLPTARHLLTHYRIEGEFDREETLLRRLLGINLITANDAERLGLLLASNGDLYGARDALVRFDEIANPERVVGRLALFDVLAQIGDKATALSKGASWTVYWRKVSLHHPSSGLPAARLIRMMLALDEPAARKAICEVQREEFGTVGVTAHSPLAVCDLDEPDSVADSEATPGSGTGASNALLRDEVGRRRRR
jgi:tetratricopeptide (TPR) repeat protein